ncbi:hypothetical protein H920_08252 [Fukomys damarensis]|uniref:Uncharacterized protein n=1 Tax=Fukomys damarensis TaxID=885580 RepID=A0A091DIK8_FUKDA|nr:hypothetical protein H920_08252 [Fukomys damarensis]
MVVVGVVSNDGVHGDSKGSSCGAVIMVVKTMAMRRTVVPEMLRVKCFGLSSRRLSSLAGSQGFRGNELCCVFVPPPGVHTSMQTLTPVDSGSWLLAVLCGQGNLIAVFLKDLMPSLIQARLDRNRQDQGLLKDRVFADYKQVIQLIPFIIRLDFQVARCFALSEHYHVSSSRRSGEKAQLAVHTASPRLRSSDSPLLSSSASDAPLQEKRCENPKPTAPAAERLPRAPPDPCPGAIQGPPSQHSEEDQAASRGRRESSKKESSATSKSGLAGGGEYSSPTASELCCSGPVTEAGSPRPGRLFPLFGDFCSGAWDLRTRVTGSKTETQLGSGTSDGFVGLRTSVQLQLRGNASLTHTSLKPWPFGLQMGSHRAHTELQAFSTLQRRQTFCILLYLTSPGVLMEAALSCRGCRAAPQWAGTGGEGSGTGLKRFTRFLATGADWTDWYWLFLRVIQQGTLEKTPSLKHAFLKHEKKGDRKDDW